MDLRRGLIELLKGKPAYGEMGMLWKFCLFVCLFVCFVALRPKSTAMVMAGRPDHLTTLFPGQA